MTNQINGQLDSVTVKILWDRLVSIANEATTTQQRTAFSTVVRECNDFACSIMDVRGGTLAQADIGLPSFVATQAITLQNLLKQFPLESLNPGDVLITNDPWIATGHIMDLTLLAPIFRNGKVVAFGGSVAHSPDIGGVQRWTVALDVFEEGLFIPPMKLMKAGEPNEDLFTMIRANSRTPNFTIGDLEAQLSALRIIEHRVSELIEEHDLDSMETLCSEIYNRSEEAIRSVIREIPDGSHTGQILIDNNFPDALAKGMAEDRAPLVIQTTVKIQDADIVVDFNGTSPQVSSSINALWTFTQAYAVYTLQLMMVPYFPNNAGFLRPVKVIVPSGTILNAEFPAACLSRAVIGHQVCDAIYGALAEAIPDKVMAQGGSTPIWNLIFVGQDRRGNRYNRLIPINGGLGASSRKDGEIVTFPANSPNTPVEILDDAMQVVIESKEVIPDSAGPGKYRGGFGQRVTFRAYSPIVYSIVVGRVQQPPQGLLGGWPGRAGRILLNDREISPGDGQMLPGDLLVCETPGGGGLFLPTERDLEAVVDDVREGLVSLKQARDVYGVVIDATTFEVNLAETIQLRS